MYLTLCAGNDFQVLTETLSFTVGQLQSCVTIVAVDDELIEGIEESFTITLLGDNVEVAFVNNSTITITILDDGKGLHSYVGKKEEGVDLE